MVAYLEFSAVLHVNKSLSGRICCLFLALLFTIVSLDTGASHVQVLV